MFKYETGIPAIELSPVKQSAHSYQISFACSRSCSNIHRREAAGVVKGAGVQDYMAHFMCHAHQEVMCPSLCVKDSPKCTIRNPKKIVGLSQFRWVATFDTNADSFVGQAD